ncbi:MAG: HAD family phosphatase [Fusobacteriaceae bacterium]|jgi:HAD superfamily hydrolase (TIGR01509 family)|nr:HAD family phosphatase [Fusobacteriaceae bacterium]
MTEFKAAIFDLDGTILDSMGVWEKIDIEFLAKRNLIVSDDYVDKICALSFIDVAKYTINLYGLTETVEDITSEWNSMALYEYSNNVILKKTARDYLIRLKTAGIKLAVATTLPATLYIPVLRNNEIYDYFDIFCSTDEVKHGKGHPDIFLLAAERLNVSPTNCIVFEDILPAIISAKNAGMRVYGVYDKYSKKSRSEILKYADGYLFDFMNAPLP